MMATIKWQSTSLCRADKLTPFIGCCSQWFFDNQRKPRIQRLMRGVKVVWGGCRNNRGLRFSRQIRNGCHCGQALLGKLRAPRFVRFSFKGELRMPPGRAVGSRAILSPPPRQVVPGDHEFHRDTWFQQLGGVGFAIGACEPLPARPPSGAADVVAGFMYIAPSIRVVVEFRSCQKRRP